MNAKRSSKATGEPRYAELMEELEQILEDLENDTIDVDELSTRVARASELIRICRERLLKSRTEIEQVVADLNALDDEEGKLDETEGD